MQRITDIWQNLVQRLPVNQNNLDTRQTELTERRRERNFELEKTFRNLYWTGLVSM